MAMLEFAQRPGSVFMFRVTASGVVAVVLATIIPLLAASPSVTLHLHGDAAAPIMEVQQHGAIEGRPAARVRPVSCERLPDIPGKSITTAVVEFPPRAYSPRHRHPGSVTAFVLNGTLRSQLLGGPAETFAAGQTWFEPPGAVHLFAENASASEPASLLAIFVTDADCGPLTIRD